ncbi:MAG: acyltransferase [Puniceicoccaceae bacterium]
MILQSIQLLRAIAAIMVVVFHANSLVAEKIPSHKFSNTGAAGVDLFFVISGFVMVYSCRNLFAQRGAFSGFLLKRAIRILPTYYLFTTLTLCILIFLPHLYENMELRIHRVIASYALILTEDSLNIPGTIVGVGWTLAFEAWFYLNFAWILCFSRRWMLPLLLMVFLIGTASHWWLPSIPAFWIVASNPLVFEFLFGCVIALAFQQNIVISPAISVLCIVVGSIALAVAGQYAWVVYFLDTDRIWAFGIPSALIVAGTTNLEQHCSKFRIPFPVLLLGDSSYSLYLSHTYVQHAIVIWITPGVAPLGIIPLVLCTVMVSLSVLVAIVCYQCFEKPVTAMLKCKFSRSLSPTETRPQQISQRI